ncbi:MULTISPECIES: 3-oxoacyl-ACP synthase III family protein [Sphingobacterium]|uniref:3-oxoacyl-ACP synthase n=2 Tax=Sphingobacterium multivorum TaxID=28454 RepID=A0A654DHG8_SPHMU|nr:MULTISPECIES: ketoacyl-ACP synthase III [Sphingobacterium]HAF35100.1 3-oxoacyl-ACP synthase [Sphingobacterium sp.]QQT45533.1 ketoacyl-ACP synthase III [Sphingobacterium multivorum]QQT61822.1 ketoacyl-ACP synthase III [Sphingobacterium multivorum]SUJ26612.1 3-oxoacyl-[acyl-carrier-protein] synthase 3 [Sphingobacterium multivorum]VXD04740.1 3-oxoacyl-ACP synthase [Sphingobacterium multivorum]
MNIRFIGSGSYIPSKKITNADFADHLFLDENGLPFKEPASVIEKFKAITGIEERRYADPDQVASDLAFLAGQRAIEDAGIAAETLDYIIVAHNYGDVQSGKIQSDTVPSLASRVKKKLGISNPKCVAYDLLFGCPGWNEGVLHANAFIKSGMAKRCMVIGAETLSRVIDPFDRDSMIYADGAGAVIIEATTTEQGLLSHESATYALEEANYLNFGSSYQQEQNPDIRYIKMKGRKIYEFALSKVPLAMQDCLQKADIDITAIKKILIHQANEKMDEAILMRFYALYSTVPPPDIMPMTIHTFGNSSVATIPTLYDLIARGQLDNQSLQEGDIILFASVGAGMNINAFTYRV